MAKKRKSTKKSEDLTQLLELSKTPRTKHTYTTIDGREYEIEINNVFTIGEIENCISEYMTINMCVNKFATDESIETNPNLLFAIMIQRFTDKDFTMEITDPMEKFRRYVVVAQTLHSIELENGLTLYQQIIVDFGQENLSKLEECTKAFNSSMTENREQILEMLQPLVEEGEENGKEISESFELL